ncbi:MAG: hypothetical protein ACKO46_02195, partial [Alphaproteobacteria bacterium]
SNQYHFEYSGLLNSTFGFSNQNNIYQQKILPDNFSKNYVNKQLNFGIDNQLYLKTAYKFSDKIIGATAKIESNVNSNQRFLRPNLDQFFGYFENEFFKFEIGNYLAVNQKMKQGPARFARGAGGINGKYLEYVNLPVFSNQNNLCKNLIDNFACQNFIQPKFILLAQSPIGHGGYATGFYGQDYSNNYNGKIKLSDFNKNNFRSLKDDSFEGLEDALKFSFYSQKINDFQFGFSLTPKSANQGFTTKTAPASQDNKIRNIYSFGVNYNADFDNLNVALSSTAEYGKSQKFQNISKENLLAYDFGGSLSYFGFKIGSSFGSWGKSLNAKNGNYSCNYDENKNLSSQNCANNFANKFSNSYYFTSGLGYEIGPIKASITSLSSNFQGNKYFVKSFGIDYKIQKNLISYLEFTNFK